METFASLYERTFPKVYAYVGSLLRDPTAAEDVTAQAFERAYRRRRSYRASRGTPEAWVFGIARNLASLGDSVEILVRVLGVAIPLGLVAAALGFAARALRRRWREAALSG